MSNNRLFLKSGFPSAPLKNGLGRYVCQLQRITLKFCKNNGSSKGMRDFIENNLIDFAKENPGVVVYLKPRRHRGPVMVAEYLNGERQWVNCRNNSNEEINKWADLLRGQNGDSSAFRLRKMWHTDVPSIQGAWTPFTHKAPALNLTQFPANSLNRPMDLQRTATEMLVELFEKQQLDEASASDKAAKPASE